MIVDQGQRVLVHGWTKRDHQWAGLGPVILALDQWVNSLWTMDQCFSLNEIRGEIRRDHRYFSPISSRGGGLGPWSNGRAARSHWVLSVGYPTNRPFA